MERMWPEHDAEAARQLGLDGSTHTIFMMDIAPEVLNEDQLDEIGETYGGDLMECHEAISLARDALVGLHLPPGFVLVGMMPINGRGAKRYGIVNLDGSAHQTQAAADVLAERRRQEAKS